MGKTIAEVLEMCRDYMEISTMLALSSRKKYEKVIRLFLLDVGMSFDIEDVNRFLTKKKCHNYKPAFKVLLTVLGHKDKYERVKSIKKKPRKKVFNYVDKRVLQNIINYMPSKFRYLALIQLKTGTRFLEVATIRAENIDFNRNKDFIIITLGVGKSKTKGSKERVAFLSKRYEDLLNKLIKKPYGYVFLKEEFERYDEEMLLIKLDSFKREFNKRLTECAKKEGLESLSSHWLRHMFADYFIKGKGTVDQLKVLLGHSKIDTTLQYVSVNQDQALEVLKRMEE